MTQAVLKRSEVVRLVGLGYTTVWRLEKEGEFPARRKLSAHRVGWLLSEVEAWIVNRDRLAA